MARHTLEAVIVVSQHPVLQRSPAQQGWSLPPHPAQCPSAEQRSPRVQALPVARHTCEYTSQHPASHTLPAQQGLPGVPHVWHTPRQIVFGWVHSWLPQHGCPPSPHAAHALAEQVVPGAVHELPVQHAWESDPQSPHPPALQALPFAQAVP